MQRKFENVREATGRVFAKTFAGLANLVYKRTILILTVTFASAAAVTLWNMAHLSSRLVAEGALQGTALYGESVKELRLFYRSQIVERVKGRGAIPIPATFSIEFGKHISEQIPVPSRR